MCVTFTLAGFAAADPAFSFLSRFFQRLPRLPDLYPFEYFYPPLFRGKIRPHCPAALCVR
jgi:hypothetical protein